MQSPTEVHHDITAISDEDYLSIPNPSAPQQLIQPTVALTAENLAAHTNSHSAIRTDEPTLE